MSALDILVIAIIILSGVLAFARGFVKEVLSIAGWVGASFAALYAYSHTRAYTQHFMTPGPVADAVGAFVVFLASLLVLSILTAAISRRVHNSALSAVDRTLGLIFGLVRGALLVSIGAVALSWLLPPGSDRPHWVTEARTLPVLESGAAALQRLVPGSLRQHATAAIPTQTEDAENAIKAFLMPRSKPATGGAPSYPAADQRELNRLFQQEGNR